MKSFSCPFGVVSNSRAIITKSKEFGAKFNYCDSGIDLNKALSDAVRKLSTEQAILIIMPDLPFITKKFLQQLFDKTKNEDIVIIPSISSIMDYGTAALYLGKRDLLSFKFGNNSCILFQKEAEKCNLRFLVLHSDPCARDLDTLDDVKYLKKHLTMVPNPKLFASILDQLNI